MESKDSGWPMDASGLRSANEIASRQLRDSVLTDSFEVADGMMLVPQSHGLGIEVDRAKVEQHQPVG